MDCSRPRRDDNVGGCNLNVLLGAPYNEQLPTLTTTAITGYIVKEGEGRARLSKSKESINIK